LKKWLNTNSDVKFPQKKKDLLVIKKTVNNQKLNDNILDIFKARSYYNGIMIALGRDLSDDIAEYIMTKKKGKTLKQFSDKQINEMVSNNAPLKIIKSIKVADDEN
jgi:hypothetical protein